MQAFHALNRRHNAQHAVELAGIAYGVQMRAEHQARLCRLRAFVASDHVADGVDACLHPRLLHPAAYEVVGGAVLRRQKNARQRVRVRRAARELVDAF